MEANIFITGRIEAGETLVDVMRQFNAYDNPSSVMVDINSIGGNVKEGEAICNYLEGLKTDYEVNTRTRKAYSIAAQIFSIGQTRIIEDIDNAFMIHMPRVKADGLTAEELEVIAVKMREIEDRFTEFYSELISEEESTIRSLLENETMISGQEAVDLGFATELQAEFKAVAEYDIEQSKNNKMTDTKKNKGLALIRAMKEFVGITLKEDGLEISAELTLQDSNGDEIVFPDLDSDAVPAVDDAATMDGSPIPDGSYIMPSLDNSTVVFVDGKVSEIIPEETEEEVEASSGGDDPTKPKTEVNAEEIKEVVTWSVQTSNTSFEEGETLMLEPWDSEMEDYAASAGEWKLSDGRSIVTDASGVIVKVNPAPSTGGAEASFEGSFEELLEKVTSKVTTEVSSEYQVKIDELEAKITALNKQIKSPEIQGEGGGDPEPKPVLKGAAKYLNAAREM